jgi:hypothetical protein
MYVAIQQQNLRNPVVFGLGATADEALADASQHVETLDEITALPCSDELAADVQRGVVDCAIENGIAIVR